MMTVAAGPALIVTSRPPRPPAHSGVMIAASSRLHCFPDRPAPAFHGSRESPVATIMLQPPARRNAFGLPAHAPQRLDKVLTSISRVHTKVASSSSGFLVMIGTVASCAG